VTRALKLSTPKLKYLKKPSSERLVTIETTSAVRCRRPGDVPGSIESRPDVITRPQM